MTYSQKGRKGYIVVDAALSSGPQCQADEPRARNPELVVRRWQVFQVPQLL